MALAREDGISAEEYDANGVDRTLIRACLRESPLECLQALEEMHQLAESVRGQWKTDSSCRRDNPDCPRMLHEVHSSAQLIAAER
jgi:hypothetical protein